MRTNHFIRLIRTAAISGNILFVFWITYNSIDESFSGKLIEKISYITFVVLLITNSMFLISRGRNDTQHS